MAMDRRNYRQLVDTTVEIATKVRERERGGGIVGMEDWAQMINRIDPSG